MKGFLKIDRKTFSDELWREPRRFSRFEAWLDIQSRASVYDQDDAPKGTVILHKRETARNWGWGETTVLDFINKLVRMGKLFRTDKRGVFSLTDPTEIPTKNPTALNADNHRSYADTPTDNPTQNPTSPPFIIKEDINKNACARGTRDANGDEELFARFHEWARQNLPTLASGIDIATFRMMRGRTYGSTAKMLKVLQAMEGEGCQGDILREYERRCPR